jgi:hypothetical protein
VAGVFTDEGFGVRVCLFTHKIEQGLLVVSDHFPGGTEGG